jgi:hypothetical protein
MFLGCHYTSPGAVWTGRNLKNVKLFSETASGKKFAKKD